MTVQICPDKDAACSEFAASLRCADCPTLSKVAPPPTSAAIVGAAIPVAIEKSL